MSSRGDSRDQRGHREAAPSRRAWLLLPQPVGTLGYLLLMRMEVFAPRVEIVLALAVFPLVCLASLWRARAAVSRARIGCLAALALGEIVAALMAAQLVRIAAAWRLAGAQ